MSDFINQFIDEQRAAVANDNLELFLLRMFELFYELGTAPQLQGRELGTPVFDVLCQAAGVRAAFELGRPFTPRLPGPHNIILLTEIVALGGHAEIVRDIIRTSSLPVMLVVTDINRRALAIPEDVRGDANVVEVVLADDITLLGKMQTVQAALSNPGANKIFMLAHGYDAVAVSSISPELSARTFYLHHCDHYPALGCHIPGAVHLDLHNLGFKRCRHENNIPENRYLCLTSRVAPARRGEKPFASPYFISATCGGGHKLSSIDYHLSYQEVVINILKRRKGVHFHLGPLPPAFLDDMSLRLRQQGLDPDQFCCLGAAPGLAEILTQLDVDVYLPTLPQSGGKALIDAMAAGVPILLHQNARDRLWSSVDIVYPEAPSWRDLEEMNDILDRFDADFWAAQSAASRRYFDRYHSNALFSEQLDRGGDGADSKDIPALKAHLPDVGAYLRYSGFRQELADRAMPESGFHNAHGNTQDGRE